jgi:hypothetical protein
VLRAQQALDLLLNVREHSPASLATLYMPGEGLVDDGPPEDIGDEALSPGGKPFFGAIGRAIGGAARAVVNVAQAAIRASRRRVSPGLHRWGRRSAAGRVSAVPEHGLRRGSYATSFTRAEVR